MQALAQTGLTYARDPYDIERYEAIRRIAAEMAAGEGTETEVAALEEAFAGETGYATPKVDVRGVFSTPKAGFLLVRERSDGKWTLPGGWADVGVSPAENVTREIFEEAGFQTRATKLLAVYDRSRHGHPPMLHTSTNCSFLCEITGGEAAAGGTTETDGVAFFAPGEIPPLSTGRVTAAQLDRFFEHRREPECADRFRLIRMTPSSPTIKQAFVLAAGLGTRLRPLTEHLPKPLIPIGLKPLITFAFDHLIADLGVEEFIVNTHHCAERVRGSFPRRPSTGAALALPPRTGAARQRRRHQEHRRPARTGRGDADGVQRRHPDRPAAGPGPRAAPRGGERGHARAAFARRAEAHLLGPGQWARAGHSQPARHRPARGSTR